MLSTDERIEVVGLAESGDEAVTQADDLEPDVVLMDISMPGLNGVEATRRIVATRPEARVLMVTGSDAQEDVEAARTAGAAGYMTKDRIAAELVVAILDAAAVGTDPEGVCPQQKPLEPGCGYDSAVLQFVAVLQVLLSIALIGLILMHSGRDTGFGGMGFTPASQGGTHIVERNLTRLTVAVGVAFTICTVALFHLLG